MLMIILIIRYKTNGPSFLHFGFFFEIFHKCILFISIQKINPYISVIIINVEVTRLNTNVDDVKIFIWHADVARPWRHDTIGADAVSQS